MDGKESPVRDGALGPVVLAALYLSGAPSPNMSGARGRWPRVLDIARRHFAGPRAVAAALRSAGLWDEAHVLVGTWDWAASMVTQGAVLTAACPAYPIAWRRRLGSAAPPALWVSGSLPIGACLGVVGSREPVNAAVEFVQSLATTLAEWGVVMVSGGAWGVDRVAAEAHAQAGGNPVEVLPCGLGFRGFGLPIGSTRLTPRQPGQAFSAGAAMERNALVYAYGGPTLVVQPRNQSGGTWAGASGALRRRLGPVTVWQPPPGILPAESELAVATLVALGANPWHADPGAPGWDAAVCALLSTRLAPGQATLFGAGEVREAG